METSESNNRIIAPAPRGTALPRRSAMARMVMPGQALACLPARTGRGDPSLTDTP